MFPRRWLIAALVMVCGSLIVLFAAGCSSDSSSTGGGGSAAFSVHFPYTNQDSVFVIIQESLTDRVLAVKKTVCPGTVEFDGLPARGTVTMAMYHPPYSYLNTYLDVPLSGRWDEGSENGSEPMNQGWIDVHYPQGDYSRLFVSAGDLFDAFRLPPGDSSRHVSYYSYFTPNDAGKISLFGLVFGEDHHGYFGWLLDQPFNTTDSALYYTLNLTRPAVWHPLTFSRSPRDAYVSAFRLTYGIEGIALGTWNSYNMAGPAGYFWCGDLPVDRFFVSTTEIINDFEVSYGVFQSQIPQHVEMPDLTVTTDFDSASGEFRNVSVNTLVDAMEFDWTLINGSGQHYGNWDVTNSGRQNIVRPPALPDSLRAIFAPDSMHYRPDYVSAIDYGHIPNYDQYVRYQNSSARFADYDEMTTILSAAKYYERPDSPEAAPRHVLPWQAKPKAGFTR